MNRRYRVANGFSIEGEYAVLTLWSGLIRPPCLHNRNGIDKATDRLLVILRNAAIFLHQGIFLIAKRVDGQCGSHSRKDVKNVETQFGDRSAEIGRRSIAGAALVVGLGTFDHSQRICKLLLRQPTSLTFLGESRADYF